MDKWLVLSLPSLIHPALFGQIRSIFFQWRCRGSTSFWIHEFESDSHVDQLWKKACEVFAGLKSLEHLRIEIDATDDGWISYFRCLEEEFYDSLMTLRHIPHIHVGIRYTCEFPVDRGTLIFNSKEIREFRPSPMPWSRTESWVLKSPACSYPGCLALEPGGPQCFDCAHMSF